MMGLQKGPISFLRSNVIQKVDKLAASRRWTSRTRSNNDFYQSNSSNLFYITAGIGLAGLAYGAFGRWDGSQYGFAENVTSRLFQITSTVPPTKYEIVDRHAADVDLEESVGNDVVVTSFENDDLFAEKNADEFQVFSGSSNPDLAREICSHLSVPLGRVRIGRFADGEVTLEVIDEVRGQDVFVVQSAPSASSNSSPQSALMELCFLISALKRASAKRVTAVLPYMSYFRQTVQTDQARPLGASDIGRMLTTMGVDRVIFVDVHSQRAEGFFPETVPITNLQPQNLAIEYFKRKKELNRNVVVVSTDNTGTEKAEAFMSRLQQAGFETDMATLVSNRPERLQKEKGANVIGPKLADCPKENRDPRRLQDWLVGDVQGKDCIIVDDIIDTGERAVNAAHALKASGARRIFMFATHGLFSRGAIDRITKSPIKELVVTDTIRIPENLYCEKLRVISVSRLLAEAILRIHKKLPLSTLHRDIVFDGQMTEKTYQR